MGADIDWRNDRDAVGIGASVGAISTGGFEVDIVLEDGGPHHGGAAAVETGGDALDGGEIYFVAAK